LCAYEGPAGSISSQNRGAEGFVGAALVELTVWLKIKRYAALAVESRVSLGSLDFGGMMPSKAVNEGRIVERPSPICCFMLSNV